MKSELPDFDKRDNIKYKLEYDNGKNVGIGYLYHVNGNIRKQTNFNSLLINRYYFDINNQKISKDVYKKNYWNDDDELFDDEQ